MNDASPLRAGDRPVGSPFATRSPVYGTRGMVATSQPLAAQVGLSVLQSGGNAVDAALAANAVLGLVEPTGCGVGGDLFVLLWHGRERRLVGLNGSGRSPRGLTLAALREQLARSGHANLPPHDALSVSVPGCVDGWCTIHARYGSRPLAELLAPAIGLARDGFPLTPVIADDWGRAEALHGHRPSFAATFLPGGRAPAAGAMVRNPDLAATYELLARGGRDAFYRGALARAIARCVQAEGGALTEADLAAHHSEWVEPVSVPHRGHELWELPPNGQGLAALQMLRLLEPFALRPFDAASWHLMIEAKKLAYEDRARLYADPDFAAAPVERLLSAAHASRRRDVIDPERAATAYAPGQLPLEPGDTVYLTAADGEGTLVSWIQSNYMGFGSGLVPEGTGFGLQNRGCLFALDPAHANVFAPGKRPFHTIIPAMLTKDGEPVLSFGVMGGAMQPQGHVQIVTNLLDHGFDVQAAGDAPRWRHAGSSQPTGEVMEDGGEVHLETGVPEEVVAGLVARGHRVSVHGGGYGGYQAIAVSTGPGGERVYQGASESRKDGAAVGW